MPWITATRVKAYSPNFALYKVDPKEAQSVNTLKEGCSGDKAELPANWNGVIGVRELGFVGWAKGKTGRHALNEPNTEQIVLSLLRVHDDGKVDGCKWQLVDQDEVDRLYSQRVCFNI